MFPRTLLLLILLLATLPAMADHISWQPEKHFPKLRYELTTEEKAVFDPLAEPLPTTGGKAVEWNTDTRTLTTRSWGKGKKQGSARYTETIQKLSEDGMQLTTLRRSRLHSGDWDDYTASTHTAIKPCLFIYPPSLIVEGSQPTLEQWAIGTSGKLRYVERSSSSSDLCYIMPTARLKNPENRLMDGVAPFPAPADEPILTGHSNCHRHLNPATYDAATRTLTWECRRHLDSNRPHKARGPINIYQFRVAPDNRAVDITRRIYLLGYTAPIVRTCRLTTATPGDFADSYGRHYYFTLTPDGHIATFSRDRSVYSKRSDGSTAPILIFATEHGKSEQMP